jgi:hypothetical protein
LGDPIENAIGYVRNKMDKRYDASGEKALAHWAKQHHVDKSDPRYQRKLDNYKYHQAESTVDSLIVAGAAAASNITAQKYLFKNTNPWPVITGSKLVGSAATLALMFGANKAFPNFMQTFQHELSDKYFSKAANVVTSRLGLETSKTEDDDLLQDEDKKSAKKYNHFPVMETAATGTATALFLQKMANSEEELVHFLPKSLAVGGATVGGMFAAHWLIPDSIRTFNRELATRYLPSWRRAIGMGRDADTAEESQPDASEKQKQSQNEPLAHDKRQRFLASLQRSYQEQGGHDIKEFVAEQKRICQAFVQALYPEGRFAKKLSDQYKQAIQGAGGDGASIDAFMEDMLLHRRDAMLARLKLLDDQVFVAELESTLKSNKTLVAASGVSPEKKEKLISGLMQAKTPEAITQSASQQRKQQGALLAAFDPASEASRILADALSTQLDGKDMKRVAVSYMQERQEAARNVTLALEEDGEILASATSRSQKGQTKSVSWQSSVVASKAAAAKNNEAMVIT